ncbi:ATP-grasp domain-containing protein [Bacillus mycoides]|uniref:ATP-grasp domain-containing protein n=1 Tax=Bacillus mycoides TaxID=1405 RepID=UPI003D261F20
MNILLTSAGRRNYLVKYFRDILKGIGGKVYCTDASTNAPIIQEADKTFIVPRVENPAYFDALLKICKDYEVKIIFSLNDLEIPLLAKQRERFLEIGVIPVVSQYEIIDLCRDKLKYNSMLQQCNLNTPKTYSTLKCVQEALINKQIDFPLVIKPRWGTASIGVEFVYDEYELELAFYLLKRKLSRTILSEVSKQNFEHSILIQEKLEGTHYSVDIINDLNGRYVTTLVKEVISMRAGDIDKAKTVGNLKLQK